MSTTPSLRQETYTFPVQQPIRELFYDLDPELISPITEWVAEQGIPSSDVALLRFSMFIESVRDWDHHFAYVSAVDRVPNLEGFRQFEAIDIHASTPEQAALGWVGIFYRWVSANWSVHYAI